MGCTKVRPSLLKTALYAPSPLVSINHPTLFVFGMLCRLRRLLPMPPSPHSHNVCSAFFNPSWPSVLTQSTRNIDSTVLLEPYRPQVSPRKGNVYRSSLVSTSASTAAPKLGLCSSTPATTPIVTGAAPTSTFQHPPTQFSLDFGQNWSTAPHARL